MTETVKPEDTAPKTAAAPKKASPKVPQAGDVVLHETFNAARHATEDQALVVIGSTEVQVTPEDPNDHRRETHLLAVPIGWVKDLFQVPATHHVPVVGPGGYAQLRPDAYRLP